MFDDCDMTEDELDELIGIAEIEAKSISEGFNLKKALEDISKEVHDYYEGTESAILTNDKGEIWN